MRILALLTLFMPILFTFKPRFEKPKTRQNYLVSNTRYLISHSIASFFWICRNFQNSSIFIRLYLFILLLRDMSFRSLLNRIHSKIEQMRNSVWHFISCMYHMATPEGGSSYAKQSNATQKCSSCILRMWPKIHSIFYGVPCFFAGPRFCAQKIWNSCSSHRC